MTTFLNLLTVFVAVFAFIILNLDGGVGRKALLVYSLMMYIGQVTST
jgi:hypothetical protein